MNSHSLIARVRRGELNFERFIEILSTRGYITENNHEEGCSFGSSAMEAARQDDLDTLFSALMPGVMNDIALSCASTKLSGPGNVYSYALFNKNIIDREEIHNILKTEKH